MKLILKIVYTILLLGSFKTSLFAQDFNILQSRNLFITVDENALNAKKTTVFKQADPVKVSFSSVSDAIGVLLNISSTNLAGSGSHPPAYKLNVDVDFNGTATAAYQSHFGAGSGGSHKTTSLDIGALNVNIWGVNMPPQDLKGERPFVFDVSYSLLNLEKYAFISGQYNTFLTYHCINSSEAKVLPDRVDLIVDVKPFITTEIPVPGVIGLLLNNFKYFRNPALIEKESTYFSLLHTVPLKLEITNDDNKIFFLSDTYPGVKLIGASEFHVFRNFNNITNGTKTDINIDNAKIDVPIGNRSTLNMTYKLRPDELRKTFINMGTYSLAQSLIISDYTATHSEIKPIVEPYTVKVIVPDMSEITSNVNNVALQFKSIQDYQQGVKSDGSDYLMLSKTTPFDLYVRASEANFNSGSNTLPIGILGVRTLGEAENKEISSISDKSQRLISGGAVLDKKINLQYFIAQDKTKIFMNNNFKSGTYTADLIYSFTAQ